MSRWAGERSLHRRSGAGDDVHDVVLLALLARFAGLGRDQTIGVDQIRQVGLGRQGSGIFLGEQNSAREQESRENTWAHE